MMRQPALFVSHGAPTLALTDGPAHRFLRSFGHKLGEALDRPRAILVLSAHFEAPVATITSSRAPQTVHDFWGFAPALYELEYPAPGDLELAQRISQLLSAQDLPTRLDSERGLDHGAWIVLLLMYPRAEIPVLQLSIAPKRGPEYHLRLGQALRPLRDEGVLIVGSGGATHNLTHASASPHDAPLTAWADAFRDWLASAVAERRHGDIVQFRERAPHARRNHPTDEHLLPLLCALGAAYPEESGRRVHASATYGSLAMDTYVFGDPRALVELKGSSDA